MTIQEEIDSLRESITGQPCRTDISNLLDILEETEDPEKHEYIINFLDFYPTSKDKILKDLNSYPNYGS